MRQPRDAAAGGKKAVRGREADEYPGKGHISCGRADRQKLNGNRSGAPGCVQADRDPKADCGRKCKY